MKKLFAVCALTLGLAVTSLAGVVMQVDSQYESGATFSGLVTFTDDFSNVLDVDGWLVGGPYGNDYINWIWDPTINFAASFGPQYGGNFLMDGVRYGNESGSYTYFIAFTWDFSGAPNLVFASPGGILSDSGGNSIIYADPLVSGQIGSASIPEPGTIGLLTAGLLGLVLFRRRR